jgi:AraC-like DNA-binding protein
LELEWVRGVDGAPCAMWVLLLPPALLATAEPASDGRDGTSAAPASACSGLVDDPALYARLCASVDELRRPLAPVDCVGRLRECVAALVTRREDPRCSLPSSTRRQHAGLARVGAHLREHVAEDVSLDELAELAGLSKFYLLRAFAREHGVTPRAYQMLLRAARAWRLIGEGLSLSRAAYDTGFADQSHLTRRFAELYGVTPGRWARLLAVPPGSLPVGAPILGHGAASSSAA